MLLRNLSNWSNTVDLRHLLFFAQRMDELTYEYSLDSYRAPATNAPYLVSECISAISLFLRTDKSPDASKHIFEEAITRLRSNPIVGSLIEIDLNRIVSSDRSKPEQLRDTLRVLRSEINPEVYLTEAFAQLRKSVEKGNREEIDFLAREVCTTLTTFGVSSFYINYKVLDHFFGASRIEGLKDLDKFIEEVFPKVHEFKVVLKGTADMKNIGKDVLSIFKIELSEINALESGGDASILQFQKIKKDLTFVTLTEIRAPDEWSAAALAKERVAQVQNLTGLFHHQGIYEILNEALVERTCCGGARQVLKAAVNFMHFVPDTKLEVASKKLDTMIKGLKLPSGPDRDKFFRIVDFHGMSAQSYVPENQLLNIWTCMETIVPPQHDRTTITNVVEGALPFLGLNYFYRLFKTLMFDIIRWNKKEFYRSLRRCSALSHEDLVHDAFSLIIDKTNDGIVRDLLSKMDGFELLRYRVYQINKTFSQPESVIAKLENHLQLVRWQLHRIYRARNAVVHSAEDLRIASSLVMNAHDYFDQVFALNVDFCSGPKGFNNYRDSFNFAKMRFDQYRTDLKTVKTVDATSASKVLWRKRRVPATSWRDDEYP